MSISFKFNTAPEEVYGLGNCPAEIWDIIYTYKNEVEWRDRREIPEFWFDKILKMKIWELRDFCKKHKIRQVWRRSASVMAVEVINAMTNRNLPDVPNVKAHSKWGMTINILSQLLLDTLPPPIFPKDLFNPNRWNDVEKQWSFVRVTACQKFYNEKIKDWVILMGHLQKYICERSFISNIRGYKTYRGMIQEIFGNYAEDVFPNEFIPLEQLEFAFLLKDNPDIAFKYTDYTYDLMPE